MSQVEDLQRQLVEAADQIEALVATVVESGDQALADAFNDVLGRQRHLLVRRHAVGHPRDPVRVLLDQLLSALTGDTPC